MTSLARDAPRAVSADGRARRRRLDPLRGGAHFLADAAAVADVELRKLRHDPFELVSRAVQPVLWLVVFGQVMSRTRAIPTGSVRYIDFLAPGILAQATLFVAIFYGIAVIWERDLGILHKYLVTPAARAAIVSGKAVSAGARALTQGLVVYLVAAGLRVDLRIEPLAIAGTVFTVLLGAAVFATFSLVIACLVKTRERFMGIGQVLTMPLFFASNAIYPISTMPGWLSVLAKGNPLSYQVDAVRTLMLDGVSSSFGLGLDFAVLTGTLVGLVLVAARLFPRVVT